MPSHNTSPVFFYTYVLLSRKDNKQYIGYTVDLKKRVEKHRDGQVFATKGRLPLTLIYFEGCTDEADAKQRERFLKTTNGRRYLAKRLLHFRYEPLGAQVK